MLRIYTVIFLATTCCIAAIVNNVAELTERKYDFIVVGGGTAGNVIANRLTENPHVSVLVLEAGHSNKDVLRSKVPFLCPTLTPNTPYDWNFTTSPQAELNGRSVPFPRGYMLGGSSSVNYMVYSRGSSEDFDRYSRIAKDEGWSWKNLQPYILKNERFIAQAVDNHNTTGQFDPAFHGFDGVNSVTLPGFPQATDSRAIQTTTELSDEFPFNLDMNSGNHIGIGWPQLTTKGGERSSSATSYLAPQYARRKNLHVLVHARVTRLLQTGSAPGKISFRDVEFSQGGGGQMHRVTARKEVILSAGAIGSPTILMHSGIGDSKALSPLGIKPLVHLPFVGHNLSDHPAAVLSWTVNGNDTYETITQNATQNQKRWNETRTGPFVNAPVGQIGWLRVPDNATIFKTFSDPAAGPHTAHYELIVNNGYTGPPGVQLPPNGHIMSIVAAVVSPASYGSVSINSSDPFSPPIINPNFLASPVDMFVLREAIRSAQRFATAPAWADYILSPFNGNPTTDTELDEFIRANTRSIFHPVGTAAMSAQDATDGVVNPDLSVKGIKGLRVVDASVIPKVPAAHTQAPVYIFAERAADIIKAKYNKIYDVQNK